MNYSLFTFKNNNVYYLKTLIKIIKMYVILFIVGARGFDNVLFLDFRIYKNSKMDLKFNEVIKNVE